ncbi:MAG: PAS domain-containing protein [Methylococcales bacterium]|nr:PAS domain-containing protein [Methylococcales bacterium]
MTTKKTTDATPHIANTNFPIIGIGASAGGLEAFEQFFHAMPVNSGLAFVLVPHLDPSHGSLLTEILQRATTMPVMEALDQLPVEANHVYIIPPNRDMEIFHGKLQLTVPTAPRGQRLPIDNFLRSLAEDQQENAIGIILSGTGTDGTQGARAIHGMGGIVLVQEPSTAKYDGMPTSVVYAGYATHSLPIETMWATLQTDMRSVILPIERPAPAKTVTSIKHILIQLRAITGHDFALYKQSTIGRRIERRMLQHNIDNIDIYARYLKENPAEARILFKELLINVTSFFRDAEAFAMLENSILPSLCADKPENFVFRAWVAGCSTGEEAYSIAILLREFMTKTHQEFKVQIYSTDLDEEVIAIARAGFYAPNIVSDVTPERLQRFFLKEDTGYRIKKDIREMVVFAIQNVIKDPPFTKLDLLSCRNLMIYLEAELQNRLIPTFHYALNPDGVLFLSPSEGIGNYTELFSALDRKWKFYRALPSALSTRLLTNQPATFAEHHKLKANEKIIQFTSKPLNLAEYVPKLLAQFFAPASVIIDTKGTVLYVHGDTGKYLRPAAGIASLNIIEMAREGLSLELHAAIHAATSNSTLTLNREIQVKTNGGFSTIGLSVRPLPDSEDLGNPLLVSFQDITQPKPLRKKLTKTTEVTRIGELEHDLQLLKDNYQVSIEEQQAFNEELKSSNEELQSTNEELQSTNEELETSKEELQSVNEELITVNSELQTKIEQLSEMQNDMKNLLDNVNIGIIFLDAHLKIRRFTREAVRLHRLVATDVGRPLIDIKSVVAVDDLLLAAQQVLESLIPYEREIHLDGDTWLLARIQPYRTLDNMIDGVVLTFTDISTRVKTMVNQDALLLAEGIVNTIREPFLVLDNNLTVISASPSFYTLFQVKQQDTVGRKIYHLGDQQWNIPALRELLEDILPHNQMFENYELEHDFPIIGQLKLRLNARRIVSDTGLLQLILLSMEAIV